MSIIGRNLKNNRLDLGELLNRIMGRFQSILCSGLVSLQPITSGGLPTTAKKNDERRC